MASPDRLDFVIFGATGFTGKYTVKEAARLAENRQFTFGIAGRREDALKAILKEYTPNPDEIPVIVADVRDDEALRKMTARARVVVNCCGPYRFYGEPVIKACIATNTHHVDVSGEPQFIQTMQFKYNKEAQEAGVYIISACGFDSIPCDLGIVHTQKKFEGEVNAIESYLHMGSTSNNHKGAVLHYGTWSSLVHGMAHRNELGELRNKLYPQKLPQMTPKLPSRPALFKNELNGKWTALFPGSDRSVSLHSQRILYEKKKQRPAQIQTYVSFESIFLPIVIGLIMGIVSLLANFKCGRYLLLNYPKLFSFGAASHEGPSEETMKHSNFATTFKAVGWTEKAAEPDENHLEPPNKEMITRVSGVNPGYGFTCTALLMAAHTILREANKMPDNGGVLSPGAAFIDTSLMEELCKEGMKFEVISSKEK